LKAALCRARGFPGSKFIDLKTHASPGYCEGYARLDHYGDFKMLFRTQNKETYSDSFWPASGAAQLPPSAYADAARF